MKYDLMLIGPATRDLNIDYTGKEVREIGAVEYAVSMAEKRDIIVLAGKGHESYQEIKGIRYPLDDRKIVQEALDGGVREYHC